MEENRQKPDFNEIISDAAAGLGELGVSKLLLTPQFGPRQRAFAVFTDAVLEGTPLFESTVCDKCMLCAEECEAGAISTDRSITVDIEGREFAHSELDSKACGVVHRGDDPRYSPFWNGTEKEGESPSYNRFVKDRFNHLSICVGRGCIRACLDHLEKTGAIQAEFRLPFIEGKRWKLSTPPN